MAFQKKVETVRSFTEATSSVVCCDGMRKEDGTLLIAAAAGDSYVRLYKLSEGEHVSQLLSISSVSEDFSFLYDRRSIEIISRVSPHRYYRPRQHQD